MTSSKMLACQFQKLSLAEKQGQTSKLFFTEPRGEKRPAGNTSAFAGYATLYLKG